MRTVLRALIRLYQLTISPMLGPRCRFYPSCSNYALQAIHVHGALRGSGLAGWRLLRCNPWNPGGVDFVPPRVSRWASGAGEQVAEQAVAEQAVGGVPVSDHATADPARGCPGPSVPMANLGSFPDASAGFERSAPGSPDRHPTPRGV